MTIKEFVENVFNRKTNQKETFCLGKLTEEQILVIKETTGLDVKDFERIIDNYAIIHIFSKHGDEKREAKQGQIAVTIEDFELIKEIVENPDFIISGEKDKIGNELIRYVKTIENEIVYVEEKRNKRKVLAGKTMYKKKKKDV